LPLVKVIRTAIAPRLLQPLSLFSFEPVPVRLGTPGCNRSLRTAQAKFKQKYDLPFTLLADEDKSAAEAYGVWKEKNMYGKTVMGIERTTFVIGADGKIEKIYAKVKARGHAEEVLAGL
jgi:peroxiredoxin Q/BCP